MFRLMLASLLLVFSIQPMAQENAISTALTYSLNGETYVATYDGDWSIETLPNFMLTGQYDVMTIAPLWTEDGRLIGAGYDPALQVTSEPKYTHPSTYLKVYDIHAEQFTAFDTPIARPIIDAEGEIFPGQILNVDGLSPDGAYGVFNDILQSRGYLVDINTGDVLFSKEDCGFLPIYWTDDAVFLGGWSPYGECAPFLAEFNFEDGEITANRAGQMTDLLSLIVLEQAIPVPDERWLVIGYDVNTSIHLALITEDAYQVISDTDRSGILSPVGEHVLFPSREQLLVADLNTGEVMTVSTDRPRVSAFVDNETVAYSVDRVDDSGGRTLGADDYHIPSAVVNETTVFFNGETPHRYAFSPALDHLATLEDGDLHIYTQDAQKIWSSTTTSWVIESGTEASLSWVGPQQVVTSLADQGGTLLVDLTDERVGAYGPPEPGAHLVGQSPDGAWWLYLVPDTLAPQFDFRAPRLLVYSAQTGETTVLTDVTGVEHDYRFMLEDQFTWWQADQ